jgi:hypothetical protein
LLLLWEPLQIALCNNSIPCARLHQDLILTP